MKAIIVAVICLNFFGWINAEQHTDPNKLLEHYDELTKQGKVGIAKIAVIQDEVYVSKRNVRTLLNEMNHQLANNQSVEHLKANLTEQYHVLRHVLLPKDHETQVPTDTLLLMAHATVLCEAADEMSSHLTVVNAHVHSQSSRRYSLMRFKNAKDAEIIPLYEQIALDDVAYLEYMLHQQQSYLNSTGLKLNKTQIIFQGKALAPKAKVVQTEFVKLINEVHQESHNITRLLKVLEQEKQQHKPTAVTEKNLSNHILQLKHILVPSNNHTTLNHLIVEANKWNHVGEAILSHNYQLSDGVTAGIYNVNRVVKQLEASTDQDLTHIFQGMLENDVDKVHVLLASFEAFVNRH